MILFEVVLSELALVQNYLRWHAHKYEDDTENHRKETRMESV